MKDKEKGVPANLTGTTMEMGIKDRLILGGLFPEKTNIMEQRLMKDILLKSELTQEQMKKAKMVPAPEGGVTWNFGAEKKIKDLSIRFSETEVGFLKDQVKRLDDTKQVTRDIFELCEKINSLDSSE